MSSRRRTVCVVDNGLFAELAMRLARDFTTVYYYAPWEGLYPTSTRLRIGTGLPGVTKIDHWAPVLDDVDLWVFPDVNHGPLQQHLVGLGKRVWGSRLGEELELFRASSKTHMRRAGVPVSEWHVVTGTEALRTYLRAHEDQFVKISRTRGDAETFHAESYELAEPQLDELDHHLGALKRDMEFVVEPGIPDACEIGYDGYTVDGQFPDRVLFGVECKDLGYVGQVKPYAKIPKQLRTVNDALVSTFKRYGYRNFFSTEVRVTKNGEPFLIDPTCRMPSPPGELMMELYSNLADILWEGADGTLVDPEPAAAWGAEIILKSKAADTEWAPVHVPPAIRDRVKVYSPAIIDGQLYVVPQRVGMTELGAAVGLGDTMEAAIDDALEIARQVKGFRLEIPSGGVEQAKAAMENLADYGIAA